MKIWNIYWNIPKNGIRLSIQKNVNLSCILYMCSTTKIENILQLQLNIVMNCEDDSLGLSARWCLVSSAHSQPFLSFIANVFYWRRSGHPWYNKDKERKRVSERWKGHIQVIQERGKEKQLNSWLEELLRKSQYSGKISKHKRKDKWVAIRSVTPKLVRCSIHT
jgi:hypothetical protein